MKLLVIGSGMMGSAAAYDMARQDHVDSVTLADSDRQRAKDVAARVNRIADPGEAPPVQTAVHETNRFTFNERA